MRWLPLLLLVLASGLSAAEFDLVFRHGRIIDGTGAPARPGDVAIKGGRLAAVGEVRGTGTQEIDVHGQAIAPGFIDVHTHSERIAKLPVAENFLRMGVTTIVTGNCGGSRLDLPAFFQELTKARVAVNVATLIGHNSVRTQAMGGNFMREPTAAELEEMKRLVDQAMRAGAVGFSTGLIYVPGTYAKTPEILALAKVAAAHCGIYASHMRSESGKIFEALDEVFTIAREAGMPAEVSHLKLSGPGNWNQADQVLARLDQARAEGLRITHDLYGYTASSTTLDQLIPDEDREGTLDNFRQRLQDPTRKADILRRMQRSRERAGYADYSYAVIASFPADPSLNGQTIPAAARAVRGSGSLADQMELILDLKLRGSASGVFHSMSEPDLLKFLRHPLTMIASDGGPRVAGEEMPHPRSYGNNARILSRYVREQQALTLEEAVRRMTSLPAQTFRLAGRGVLTSGAAADVVVFDPAGIADKSTFDDPHHFSEGISEMTVNGILTLHRNQLTGSRGGGPLRPE